MSLNSISLEARTTQAACNIIGFLQADPSWPLRITPDQMDVIYFIIMNYAQRHIPSRFTISISTIRNPAPDQFLFPKSWLTEKERPKKAACKLLTRTKAIFMEDAFSNWRKTHFTTSLLSLPTEVLLLISSLLRQKSLVALCLVNRRLYGVADFQLYRPFNRAIDALYFSLFAFRPTVCTRAVEALSKTHTIGNHVSKYTIYMCINRANMHMLEYMAHKGGDIGKIFDRFLRKVLAERLYPVRRYHIDLSVEGLLKLGADPNALGRLRDTYIIQYGPMLWIAICDSNGLPPTFYNERSPPQALQIDEKKGPGMFNCCSNMGLTPISAQKTKNRHFMRQPSCAIQSL